MTLYYILSIVMEYKNILTKFVGTGFGEYFIYFAGGGDCAPTIRLFLWAAIIIIEILEKKGGSYELYNFS